MTAGWGNFKEAFLFGGGGQTVRLYLMNVVIESPLSVKISEEHRDAYSGAIKDPKLCVNGALGRDPPMLLPPLPIPILCFTDNKVWFNEPVINVESFWKGLIMVFMLD